MTHEQLLKRMKWVLNEHTKMKRYRQAIILYTGFQQSDERRSGFEDGFFQHVAPLQDSNTLVFAPRTWKSNVKELANQLRRQGVERVALLSYSHGQAAATAFARYAYEIGIDVNLWLACDPVYRPTWLPRCTMTQLVAFRAMLKTGKIKIPFNIKRTAYIRQEKDMPRGHTLVPEDESQIVELAGILHTRGHCEIDEAPEWWALVSKELKGWVKPPRARVIVEKNI